MKTAAILVGGKGTRLQSLVSDVPKPLAKVAGEPFLYIILRALRNAGVEHVVLLTGYMHEKVVAACGDGKKFNLKITYSQEHEALGTAGALKNAESDLAGCEEFLLLNGDTYIDCSLKDILNYPLGKDILGVVGVTDVDDPKRYGAILLEENSNQIKSFQEKENFLIMKGLFVSAGIYKFSYKIFQHIPKNKYFSLETEVFPRLLENERKLHVIKLAGDFCDIGIPESYANFNLKRVLNSNRLNPIARVLLSVFLRKGTVLLLNDLPNETLVQYFKECQQWKNFFAKIEFLSKQELEQATAPADFVMTVEDVDCSKYIDNAAILILLEKTLRLGQQNLYLDMPLTELNLIMQQIREAWENLQVSLNYFYSEQNSNIEIGITG